MKIEYDHKADALYIVVSEGEVEDTVDIDKDVNVDVDKDNKIMGIEILNVVKHLSSEDFGDFVELAMKIKPFLTVQETADMLSVDAETIRRKIKRKEIHAINMGGSAGYRIPKSTLGNFLGFNTKVSRNIGIELKADAR